MAQVSGPLPLAPATILDLRSLSSLIRPFHIEGLKQSHHQPFSKCGARAIGGSRCEPPGQLTLAPLCRLGGRLWKTTRGMCRGRSLVERVEVTDTLTRPTALACCEGAAPVRTHVSSPRPDALRAWRVRHSKEPTGLRIQWTARTLRRPDGFGSLSVNCRRFPGAASQHAVRRRALQRSARDESSRRCAR